MPKPLHLKDVPEDILKFILKVQWNVKTERCINQYSMEQAIYKIIKDHPDFQKKKS